MINNKNLILLGSVIAMLFSLFSQKSNATNSVFAMRETNLPLIDQAVPPFYETATFGLG